MDFNYQKAYCVWAVPAFENLNDKQKTAFSALYSIVGERQQNRALNIPTCEQTDTILKELSCLEISELSRASYFIGHWQPDLIGGLFDNTKGQSWKVSNVCDQELRTRLLPCRSLQIHEGVLRVTFSNRNCWTWKAFGLATEKNVKIFKECGLSFGESTLEKSAKQLSSIIGDMWTDVENMPDNDLYKLLLENRKQAKLKAEKDRHTKKLKDLAQAVKDAEKELIAFTWLINAGISVDNCIYYTHKDIFSFGWIESIQDAEKEKITKLMAGFPYEWEFK